VIQYCRPELVSGTISYIQGAQGLMDI